MLDCPLPSHVNYSKVFYVSVEQYFLTTFQSQQLYYFSTALYPQRDRRRLPLTPMKNIISKPLTEQSWGWDGPGLSDFSLAVLYFSSC